VTPATDPVHGGESLRVLLVNGNYEDGTIGGTQTFTRNLAHALADAGHIVAVACQGDVDGTEERDGIRIYRIRPPRIDSQADGRGTYIVNQSLAIHNPYVARKFARSLAAFDPDVCHVQMLRRLTPAVLTALRRRRRTTAAVQTVHEPFSLWNFNAFQRRDSPDKLYTRRPAAVSALVRHHRRLSRTIDHVCAPSEVALRPYLADGYFRGILRTIIPNAVPLEWGDPLAAAEHRRTEHARTRRPTHLLFIGRLDYYKGVHTLLEAFALLDTNDLRLHIAGDGVLAAEVTAWASRDPRIAYHGAVDGERRRQILRDADALICPSTWDEPFGLVVLEAYAAGLPVIAARSGALPELVTHGETGLLVAPASVPELADSMRALLDPDTRSRMGIAAAARSADHSHHAFLTAQIVVYRQALATAASRITNGEPR
jgi:glycosyltransferase involved in cell wall biosynthesis